VVVEEVPWGQLPTGYPSLAPPGTRTKSYQFARRPGRRTAPKRLRQAITTATARHPAAATCCLGR